MLNVDKLTYKKNGRTLLHEFTYTFHPGTLYGIVGPNGSGKTTLLKTLSRIWLPTSGQVSWMDTPIDTLERIEISRILTLFSQSSPLLFDYLTWEIVAMGTYAKKGDTESTHESVSKALNKVNAWHLRNRPVTELSNGERQRVLLARALATECPILLLDEPTANLDVRHQWDVWNLLEELTQLNKIVIIANHDLVRTKKTCDEVIVMHEGRCVASTLSQEIEETVFGI